MAPASPRHATANPGNHRRVCGYAKLRIRRLRNGFKAPADACDACYFKLAIRSATQVAHPGSGPGVRVTLQRPPNDNLSVLETAGFRVQGISLVFSENRARRSSHSVS